MTKTLVATALCLALLTGSGGAQTPAPAPVPAPPAPAPAAPKPGSPAPAVPAVPSIAPPPMIGESVNIRIEVTIIDEGGPQPSRKTVSVTVGDRQSGQVRSAVAVLGIGPVPLALDVLPVLQRDGRIFARITLEYQPNPGADRKEPTPVEMRLSFGVILESGRKIVAAQAADPVTDRRVSAEVTATVLK